MKRIIAILIFLAAILYGCASYDPAVNMPVSIKNIAVPIFINKTPKFNIEQYVTQKTIDEFLADGKLAIISDERQADGIVKVRITKYAKTEILHDENQVPQQYRLRIYVDVYLFDNKKQILLWKDEDIWEETTYYVANDRGMPVEDEDIGTNRVLDQLAKRVVRRVIHGW